MKKRVLGAIAVLSGTSMVLAALPASANVSLSQATNLVRVVLETSTKSVLPYEDGVADAALLTVRAAFVDGAPTRVRGSVEVLQDGKVVAEIPVDGIAPLQVLWAGRVRGKVAFGTYSLRARIRSTSDQERVSPSVRVTVAPTAIKSVRVNLSSKTVYPHKDGYLDDVTVDVRPQTTTGRPISGSVKLAIVREGRTVREWAFDGARARTVRWSGLDEGTLRTGRYQLTATAVGPEGSEVVDRVTIEVSGKKMVSYPFTKTLSVAAWDALQDCYGNGYYNCEQNSSTEMRFYNGSDYSEDLLWAVHGIDLPKGTTRYRIRVLGWTTDAQYLMGRCVSDAYDPDDCPDDEGYGFPLGGYSDEEFDTGWSSTGVRDGSADFWIGTRDHGSIYISRFIVDVEGVTKVLQ
jgi:hypothetical protein